jgi:hypothetical protein
VATRITLNSAGMRALLHDEGVRAMLTARMGRVLAQAKATAPVATGAYRDSLHLEQDTTDRAVVRVASGTDHGILVESKTGNLARALDAAGGA